MHTPAHTAEGRPTQWITYCRIQWGVHLTPAISSAAADDATHPKQTASTRGSTGLTAGGGW